VHRDGGGDESKTSYPYVGHIDDPESPTFDLLYQVPEYGLYDTGGGASIFTLNNLYQYHEKSLRELIDSNGKLLTCYVKLDSNIINTLDFKRLIKIDGVVYRLNKIENYQSGNDDTTKVELVKLIEGSNVGALNEADADYDVYKVGSTSMDGGTIEEGTSVSSLGINRDGDMVKTSHNVKEFSGTVKAIDTEKYYLANDSSTTTCTINLMPAKEGKKVVAKNGSNTDLTINAETGETIDGSSNIKLTASDESVQLYAISDTEWIII